MKIHSIKFKITCWYTLIILLVFSFVLGTVLILSEDYNENSIHEELLDELEDLQEEIMDYPEQFPQENMVHYYDDGIMLSIYDENCRFVNGVLPDSFPMSVPFLENKLQKLENEEDYWYFLDQKMTLPDGSSIWIRGIYSYNTMALMFHRLIRLICILFPALILITALVGYRMIRRSLQPISAITSTANEIIASSDLSHRLPDPKAQDEFYQLTKTINQLFDHIQQQFSREQQFTSDAAHELRTPIAVILSHCEYCLEELDLSGEAREELLIIQKKIFQMSDLVSNLLTIARAENNRYQPVFEKVELPMLAETVIEELSEKAAARNIQLELHTHPGLSSLTIDGDMEMLTRLLINLIDNAISYGRDNGFVNISIHQQEEQVCIEVKDNGIGIPADKLDKIWDRFYQVDQSHSTSGFGLGLFMVKYIVSCHKGKITVNSISGKGSTFTVLLPAKQQNEISDSKK